MEDRWFGLGDRGRYPAEALDRCQSCSRHAIEINRQRFMAFEVVSRGNLPLPSANTTTDHFL